MSGMDATTPPGTQEIADATPRAAGPVFTIEIGGRTAWVFQRVPGGNFYVKGNLPGGNQFYRSTGFSTKGMGMDGAKKLWKAALEGRWDDLQKTKLRAEKAVATIGEVVRAHGLALQEGRLDVSAETADHYVCSLRRLVAWARGLHKTVGKRRVVDAVAIDALSCEVLTEELVDTSVRNYVATAGKDELERDRKLRTVHTTVTNGRCLFEAVAMKAYKSLVLPELKGFLGATLRKAEPVEHEALADAAVREMAAEMLGPMPAGRNESALYLVHLCFRHFGMRNDEIENARVEWVEILPVQEIRTVYLADGSARHIVAKMKVCRRSYWIPKASVGEVGISADVLAELWPFLEGRAPLDYLVPLETMTARSEVVNREHSQFVRPWTKDKQKSSYELRRWGATKVARLHQSEEMADRFLRHAKKTTAQKHYLTERPMPAPITLADCGL